MVPYGNIKFLHHAPSARPGYRTFALRSPLTHEWMLFEIASNLVAAQCLPADIEAHVAYYQEMTYLLKHARDIQPLKELRALNHEESQIFGVREPDKYSRLF